MTVDVGRLRNGVWVSAVLLWALVLAMPAVLHAQPSSNVLFLIVDDLRPELPSYGRTHIHAPNIERLAEQGLVFHNAYVNAPVCGQSRESLFTGWRPFPMGFAAIHSRTDTDTPAAIPLFGALKAQGYRTYSLGKVGQSSHDMSGYWSDAPWHPARDGQARQRLGNRDYQLPENDQAVRRKVDWVPPSKRRTFRTTPISTARSQTGRCAPLRNNATGRNPSSSPSGCPNRTCRSPRRQDTGTCTARRTYSFPG